MPDSMPQQPQQDQPQQPLPDTSDIGVMYRQYLQSHGTPVTPDNIRRLVEQTRREPGIMNGQESKMMPNLTVQQEDQAQVPPNIAGASRTSSGRALPIPEPPLPPQQLQPAAAAPPQDDGSYHIMDMLQNLGIGGAGAAKLLQGLFGGRGGAAPPLQMYPRPPDGAGTPAYIGDTPQLPPPDAKAPIPRSAQGAPAVGSGSPPTAPRGIAGPSVAAQIEGPPAQPQIAGPGPKGQLQLEGPSPTTATSPIGNIFHDQERLNFSQIPPQEMPNMNTMTIKPRVRVPAMRGLRIP